MALQDVLLLFLSRIANLFKPCGCPDHAVPGLKGWSISPITGSLPCAGELMATHGARPRRKARAHDKPEQ